MNYIYGCKNKEHPTVEVSHSWKEVVNLSCGVCGQPMQRIPQVFKINVPPADSGMRNAKEISGYLKSKARQNKARREANEWERRTAKERKLNNAN